MKKLAQRIEVSQADEIKMMQDWLEARGQELPDRARASRARRDADAGHADGGGDGALAAAKGVEFDRLFLEGMIKHHGGALTMVQDLFATPGAGQEADIFAFASDVEADQRMEIDRMGAMLDGRSFRDEIRCKQVSCRVCRRAVRVAARVRRAGRRAATPTIRASASSPAAGRRRRRAQHGAGRRAARSPTGSSIRRSRPASRRRPKCRRARAGGGHRRRRRAASGRARPPPAPRRRPGHRPPAAAAVAAA